MATNDVPGANPINRDNLHTGCWAESASGDGSFIQVQGVEDGKIIYEIFDTTKSPIQAFRDAMPENQFKKTFSWDDKNTSSIKWTWHDKSEFPWHVLLKKGLQSGNRTAFGRDVITQASDIADTLQNIAADPLDDGAINAAQRVARDLGLRARDLDPDTAGKWAKAFGHIRDGLQAAINELQA